MGRIEAKWLRFLIEKDVCLFFAMELNFLVSVFSS